MRISCICPAGMFVVGNQNQNDGRSQSEARSEKFLRATEQVSQTSSFLIRAYIYVYVHASVLWVIALLPVHFWSHDLHVGVKLLVFLSSVLLGTLELLALHTELLFLPRRRFGRPTHSIFFSRPLTCNLGDQRVPFVNTAGYLNAGAIAPLHAAGILKKLHGACQWQRVVSKCSQSCQIVKGLEEASLSSKRSKQCVDA